MNMDDTHMLGRVHGFICASMNAEVHGCMYGFGMSSGG